MAHDHEQGGRVMVAAAVALPDFGGFARTRFFEVSTMGHRDVKTAMHYQHPELEIVRAALDYRPPTSEQAA